jgi:hypothetical protein
MRPSLKVEAPDRSLLGKRLVVLNPIHHYALLFQPIGAKGFKKVAPAVRKNTGKYLKDSGEGGKLHFCHRGDLFFAWNSKITTHQGSILIYSKELCSNLRAG